MQTIFSAIPEDKPVPQRFSHVRPIMQTTKVKLPWYRRIRINVSGVMPHVLFIGGLAAITVGCSMMYRPLGPVVGGIFAVSLGMLLSQEADELHKPGTQGR